jgi:Nucleotidyltransferase domain
MAAFAANLGALVMSSIGAATTGSGHGGILEGIVDVFRRRLPASEPTIYLIGSHGYGRPLPMSDIDLVIVVRSQEEESPTRSVVEWCCSISPVPLDASVMTLPDLLGSYCAQIPFLLHASRLLYGNDMREQLPMPMLHPYTKSAILLARHCVGRLYGGDWLSRADCPPHPDDEFLGYIDWGTLAPPWRPALPNTKLLVATATRLLYAALAIETGVYALTRRQALDAVQTDLGPIHQQLANDALESCRLRWQYLVPGDLTERAELRTICERFFQFQGEVLNACERWERRVS